MYIVTVYDTEGCYAYDTVVISLNSSMHLDSIISPSLCSYPTGAIQITIENPGTLSSISWSNGTQGSLSVMDLSPGPQSVQLQDTLGCYYTFDFYIPFINDLDVTISPGDTLISYGQSINLTAITNYTGSFDYSWSPSGSLSCSTCQNTLSNTTSFTTYQVIVNDQNGCLDTAFITIKIGRPCIELFIPSIFSPNSDGLNDTWEIIGTCHNSINTKVYNQWGEMIFESSDQKIEWDGTFKETKVPNDQYTYVTIVENLYGTFSTYNGSVRVMH
jgi:gliding motility-associated-like protein